MKRNAPFGKNLQQEISEIACFKISVSQNLCLESENSTLDITISSNNTGKVTKKDGSWFLVVGDKDDRVVFRERIRFACRIVKATFSLVDLQFRLKSTSRTDQLVSNRLTVRSVLTKRASKGDDLNIIFMHLQLAGFDQEQVFRPIYSEPHKPKQPIVVPSQPKSTIKPKKKVNDDCVIAKAATMPFDIGIDGEIVLLYAIRLYSPDFSGLLEDEDSGSDLKSVLTPLSSCNHKCFDKEKCAHGTISSFM